LLTKSRLTTATPQKSAEAGFGGFLGAVEKARKLHEIRDAVNQEGETLGRFGDLDYVRMFSLHVVGLSVWR